MKIKTILLTLIIAAAVLVSCAGPQFPAGLHPPTFGICQQNPITGELVRCGRGFLVDGFGGIFTAKHIVSPMFTAALIDNNGGIKTLLDAQVAVATDVDMLIVLAKINAQGDMLPLCKPLFGDFEDVIIWAKDGPLHGRATGLTRSELWMTPPVNPGDSGSPIVSIERKCIVGLVSQVMYYVDAAGVVTNHHTVGVSGNALIWLTQQVLAANDDTDNTGDTATGK